jgi:hypothetical protein
MVGRGLLVSFPDYDALTGSLRPGMAEAIEAGGGTVFEVADWKDDDEVTTTFGTLKQSVREAAEAERERIVAILENQEWDAPEIAASYVRNIVALIKGKN